MLYPNWLKVNFPIFLYQLKSKVNPRTLKLTALLSKVDGTIFGEPKKMMTAT